MSVLEGSSILVTGGTGSFGRAFISEVLAHHNPRRVAVFSRDELKQYEMKQHFPNDDRIRFFLGDVRDRERLRMAMNGVDYVVHAAALKQVDTAEYNPMEFVRTNILGSENVLTTAIDDGVKKVVPIDGQSLLPGQPVWRNEVDRGQAFHFGKPLLLRTRNQIRRGAVRQCDG